jgi:membrane protein DedA with SNARE-associated domain
MPDVLVEYGVVVLFAWAFAVQAGVPAPAVPILVGAGVLSGSGQMNLVLAIGQSVAVGALVERTSIEWPPRIAKHNSITRR